MNARLVFLTAGILAGAALPAYAGTDYPPMPTPVSADDSLVQVPGAPGVNASALPATTGLPRLPNMALAADDAVSPGYKKAVMEKVPAMPVVKVAQVAPPKVVPVPVLADEDDALPPAPSPVVLADEEDDVPPRATVPACREYTRSIVTPRGRLRQATGTACKGQDGVWRITAEHLLPNQPYAGRQYAAAQPAWVQYPPRSFAYYYR